MEISAEDLKLKIQKGDKVLVEFWASWCGPCKMMKPMFETASRNLMEQKSDVELYTFNIEENTDFVRELGIRSVPTVKGFSKGEVVLTEIGLRNTPAIMEMTKKLL